MSDQDGIRRKSKDPELYDIAFIDIVAYSKRDPPVQKPLVVKALNPLIKKAVRKTGLESDVIYLPIGDGAVVCFPQKKSACKALNFVVAFADLVDKWNKVAFTKTKNKGDKAIFLERHWSDYLNAFAFRIGVNFGPLFSYTDLRGKKNFAGSAINEAARYMTIAEPFQAVFSFRSFDQAQQSGRCGTAIQFDPLTPAIIKGVAYSGYLLRGPRGLRAPQVARRDEETKSETGRDHHPHIWIRTNHSEPRPPWKLVGGDERLRVLRIARENFKKYIPDANEVHHATHATGTDVYRVAGSRNPRQAILLKLFKTSREYDQIEKLVGIQVAIGRSKIFGKFGKCLLPLENAEKSLSTIKPGPEGYTAQAQRFLYGAFTGAVSHFSGESLGEIESVAAKLGEVNQYLIENTVTPNDPTSFRWRPEFWQEIISHLKGDIDVPHRAAYLAQKELPLIEKTFEEIHPLQGHIHAPAEVTFNDFHPHNAFVANGRCVLIFDLEAVRNDWPEVATCTFALHRLCREYVRRSYRSSGLVWANPASPIKKSASAFLKGYRSARPEVAARVVKEGIVWAKALNFAKLMGNIGYELQRIELPFKARNISDPGARTEEDHYREIIKFISYLKELNLFEQNASSM